MLVNRIVTMADSNHTNTRVHFEHRDVSARSMAWVFAAIVVTAVVLHVVLYFLYAGFRSGFAESGRVPKSQESTGQQTSAQPKLQVDPAADINHLTEEQNKKLSTYEWVDKDKGIVRIPIEQAIRMVAARGLGDPSPANTAAHGSMDAPQQTVPKRK